MLKYVYSVFFWGIVDISFPFLQYRFPDYRWVYTDTPLVEYLLYITIIVLIRVSSQRAGLHSLHFFVQSCFLKLEDAIFDTNDEN
jgi:hypothetical protein